MIWVFLSSAILLEVGGTLALRMASGGRRLWLAGTAIGYVGAFAGLTLALADGMPLGSRTASGPRPASHSSR